MDKRILEEFFQFLRFASVSADPAHQLDMTACADWLVQKCRRMGLEAELVPTAGHPAVFAKNRHQTERPTVLIYGHYDVQPPDPLELWTHPPFEPHVENGIVYARGATDNKGQIFAHLCGVEAALAEGKDLPVNLIFLIEGEEEIGSAHLPQLLQEHRDRLRCDIVVISDTNMLGPEKPAMTYGMRGLAGLEIVVKGPSRDLHSGLFGGVVANPVTVLARLVASLHDERGTIQVPGFYEGVQDPELWEREAWAGLPITEAGYVELSGAPALSGEAGYTLLERLWTRPTAEVNGLYGGYQGPGSKTVIASEAHAKLTFRLVPGQKPEWILECVEKHLRNICPEGVALEMVRGHGGEAVLMDARSPMACAALESLHEVFGEKPCLIRDGATIPIVGGFRSILEVDTLLLGLGLPDCRAHSPNENFPLANLEAGIRLNQRLLRRLAAVKIS